MQITLSVVIGIIIVGCVLLFLWEYRIRQPDVLVLYEFKGQISIRKGPIYPRHFSLPLKRTTCPIQLTVEATVSGDLGMRVKLVGSFAPSVEHVQALDSALGDGIKRRSSRATKEAQVLLEGMLKEYTERFEIHALSSTNVLNYLNERSTLIDEKFGVELISLTIQSLEPTDPEIADALRRQQQASLLEETERMSHEARVAAAKAKYQADEEIAEEGT